MTLARYFVFSFLLVASAAAATAQSAIRLHFEVYRHGALVASPEVSVAAGTSGRLELDGVGTVAFTPVFRTSDTLSIQFEINAGGRQLRPVLVIGRDARGSASWSSTGGNDPFRFTVDWVH